MPFSGFPRDGVRFFKELAVRQDRDWFKAHKAGYQALWEQPMKALMEEELAPRLAKVFRGVALKAPRYFRIYRDVRFSKDKSPFKTYLSAMIGFPGSEEWGSPAAIYVHLGTEEVVAAGHWFMEPGTLKRFRQLVAEEKTGRELVRHVDVLEKKGFVIEAMESLKKVPPGFPKDHPRGRLLKMKGLGISYPKIPKAVRFSPKLAKWMIDQTAVAAPLILWLEERLK